MRQDKGKYIATFDVGTTAVKGVLVDEAGRPAAARSFEIPTLFEGEWKEQDPRSWWAAFRKISLEFTEQVPGAQIEALAMSGQMQDLIPLDRELDPVCHAILYSDGRAGEQAERLRKAVGAEHFLALTGNRCDGSLPLPKLMWLKECRPDLYARTNHVLISSKDYLVARLTGVCAGDVTAGSTAGAMDILRKCWSGELLGSAGVSPDLFPKLHAAHERVGGVLPGAAKDCGYRPGTPVFTGTGDAGATTLASGIAAPGQYNVNLGTSGWVAAVSDRPLLTQEGVFNLAAMPEGRYINVVPFLNAGNVHGWIAGVMAGFAGREAADFDALGALLTRSVPGSGGTLFLPYLVGERFPVLDPDARGCYIGLTPRTTAADLARAALEGVAFSIRQGLERLDAAPQSVSLIGGGGREAAWCQILADVLGREVAVFRDAELLPAMAVASAALLGLGTITCYEQFTAFLGGMESCIRYTPGAGSGAVYDPLYKKFCRLHPALRTLW
jgi:xylulokinase